MASFDYNPITGQLDLVGSGGGTSYIDGDVEYHSNLPVTVGTPAVNSAFLVRKGEGLYFISRKPAGIWVRELNNGNLDDWKYAGTFSDLYRDANFRIINDADTSKELAFSLSGITTGTTRTLTAPDASGTIARTEDFAAPPAIGNTTPNSGAFTTLSANNGTITASAPVLDLSQTWNNAAVTFTGLRLNVTNTASAAASRAFDVQVGGTSFFRVIANGTVEAGSSGLSCRNMRIGNFGDSDISIVAANAALRFGTIGETVLTYDASDTFAQRRSTNAQTFRLYNTFTDASNYERGFLRWSSNVLQIGTEKAGTGSARNLELVVDGTTRMIIDTSGQIGIGNGVSLNRPFHIYGTTAWGRIDRVGTVGPAWLMVRMSTGQTVASSWLFGPLCGAGSTVAGATDDDFAISDFGTSISGVSGTARLTISKSTGQLTVNGNLNLSTKDLVTDTTTGTKIGTATNQKLGFFNATPVVQQAAIADATDAATTQARLNDLLATMRTFGLIAT